MKTFKTLLLLLTCILAMASCSESSDNSEKMTNYVSLAANGVTSMNEDDSTGIEITVNMAYSTDKDATVTLALTGDDAGAVSLSPQTVTIPAGKKSATTTLVSNFKGALVTAENISVTIASCSDDNMKSMDAKGLILTVKPVTAMPELTAAQLELINGYKKNLGIDLMKVLGVVNVSTTITFGNDDKDGENSGNDTRTLSGRSVTTLSDKATADKPVLKMLSNPMGMESFMYEKLRRCTTEDPDGYFAADPYAAALTKAVDYNLATETFSVVLDGITVNADGTLDFTAAQANNYGDEVTKVPFDYTYSVWTRLQQMGDKTVSVNEGSEESTNLVGYTVSEILNTYTQYFNPSVYLGNSDISSDTYGHSPSNYIAPSGKADFTKGTMTFSFPWDYGNGSILNDYIRVNTVYTMHQ